MLKAHERRFLMKYTLRKVHIHVIFRKNFYDKMLVLYPIGINAYIKKKQM